MTPVEGYATTHLLSLWEFILLGPFWQHTKNDSAFCFVLSFLGSPQFPKSGFLEGQSQSYIGAPAFLSCSFSKVLGRLRSCKHWIAQGATVALAGWLAAAQIANASFRDPRKESYFGLARVPQFEDRPIQRIESFALDVFGRLCRWAKAVQTTTCLFPKETTRVQLKLMAVEHVSRG